MRVQLTHSEEHRPQVEEVLTYLLADLPDDERKRIGRDQYTLEGGLVCPCIEVFPINSELELGWTRFSLLYVVSLLQCTVCGIDLIEFLFLVVCSTHVLLC